MRQQVVLLLEENYYERTIQKYHQLWALGAGSGMVVSRPMLYFHIWKGSEWNWFKLWIVYDSYYYRDDEISYLWC